MAHCVLVPVHVLILVPTLRTSNWKKCSMGSGSLFPVTQGEVWLSSDIPAQSPGQGLLLASLPPALRTLPWSVFCLFLNHCYQLRQNS